MDINNKIDSAVVIMANLINIIMGVLFLTRIVGLPEIDRILGLIAIAMGFALGYIALLNKKNNRDKWEIILLIPIFLFFIVELFFDYIFTLDFRSTAIVGLYILFYYVGLWGLVGYCFRFHKKWGFVTLATYFLNMILSVLQHFV